MADTTPPTIAITSSKTKVKAGETALITFTLSEPATDFVVSDLVFTGSGTLTGFSGSGSNYSAVFTPAPTGEGSSVVSVGNFKFSDAAGNANEDGADANNRLELTYDTVRPTIIVTSNKTYLGLGENVAVTFTLSEPSTDFTIEDITTTYGTLTGFSGSGKSYTATFVPSGVDVGLITVNGSRFSDSFGNQNDQSTRLVITPFDPSRGNVQWVRLLGTSSEEYAQALTTGTDGAIYMAGFTQGSLDGQTNSGNRDAFLTKYDANGNKAWTRVLEAGSWDEAFALTTGSDGAIYMAGSTQGSLDGQTYSGGGDAFLTKYNTDGSKAWTKLLGTSSYDEARALTTGTDGAIYMAGNTRGSLDGQTNNGDIDAFLTKFVLPDSAIPTIALQADKTSVTAGGSVAITFTLSKTSTNFIASDVTVVNGVLSNFSGSGTTYTATFTPSLGSATASLSVGSGKFSDALGNFNEDGADTDNAVTISISGSTPPTPLIQFSTTASSADEGNTGSTTVTVQATLSAASTQAVTVPISYSGTATSGTDYTNATTSITIPAWPVGGLTQNME